MRYNFTNPTTSENKQSLTSELIADTTGFFYVWKKNNTCQQKQFFFEKNVCCLWRGFLFPQSKQKWSKIVVGRGDHSLTWLRNLWVQDFSTLGSAGLTWVKSYGCVLKWWVSPTNPWVFLLKMIILGWYHHLRKHPYGTMAGSQVLRTSQVCNMHFDQVKKKNVIHCWHMSPVTFLTKHHLLELHLTSHLLTGANCLAIIMPSRPVTLWTQNPEKTPVLLNAATKIKM